MPAGLIAMRSGWIPSSTEFSTVLVARLILAKKGNPYFASFEMTYANVPVGSNTISTGRVSMGSGVAESLPILSQSSNLLVIRLIMASAL